MSKKDILEAEGKILEVLPNQMFKVALDNGHIITCYTGGKMRQFKIRMVSGDRVKVEMTPYDLTKGRITYRIWSTKILDIYNFIVYTSLIYSRRNYDICRCNWWIKITEKTC